MIEPRSVDWKRVADAVYDLRIHYRYTYTGPVRDVRQRLIVVPPDRVAGQAVMQHSLEVRGGEGSVSVTEEHDESGNRIHRVVVPVVAQAVDFEARFRVRQNGHGPARVSNAGQYLESTALTAPDPRLRAAARQIRRAARGAPPRELAEMAHAWAASALVSEFGATNYQTPAGVALHLGRGVCQDFAHVLIALLRQLGIPARYVSGHLLGEGPPHAWVEVLLEDGREVVGFDPSHRRRTGPEYITIAVGRDYADVTPTSGTFSGAARGSLSYSKSATIVELSYRERDESAA